MNKENSAEAPQALVSAEVPQAVADAAHKAPQEEAKKKFNNIAKPLHSLGRMEDIFCKIAAIQQTADINLSKRALVIMCADNGVVQQKVTQADSMVTAIVSDCFAKGESTVCTMAKKLGVDVYPVDIGIDRDVEVSGLLNKKVRKGTGDITQELAMTREEARQAIQVGINMVKKLKAKGCNIVATGEMGIGNTTTSTAIACVVLDKSPEELTGPGAGLDAEGLKRKIAAIEKALALHKPSATDAIDILSKVGGLDIAGLVGVYLGGAKYGVPVLIDGLISSVAALLASMIEPSAVNIMIATHVSHEPSAASVLEQLGLSPIICANLCLGEGTGAMYGLSMLDLTLEVYRHTITFDQIDMDQYLEFR